MNTYAQYRRNGLLVMPFLYIGKEGVRDGSVMVTQRLLARIIGKIRDFILLNQNYYTIVTYFF